MTWSWWFWWWNCVFSSLFVDVWLLFVPTKCKMNTLNWWNHIWLNFHKKVDISFVDSLFFCWSHCAASRFHPVSQHYYWIPRRFKRLFSLLPVGVTPLFPPSWSHESQTKERCAFCKVVRCLPPHHGLLGAGSKFPWCSSVARFKWSITASSSSRKTKNPSKNY